MMRFGIPDNEFIRGSVPMTKAEIRAMIMARFGIEKEDRCLDIGAGTGSVSVEMALAAPSGEVVSIERNHEGIELIRKNAEKFHVNNLKIIEGKAPEALTDLGNFDHIFIGGSGGALSGIAKHMPLLLASGGNIILTAVTLETVHKIYEIFGPENFEISSFQMQVNRVEKRGRVHMMVPLSPIFIFELTRRK